MPPSTLGVLATALWLIGRDSALGALASPAEDRGALGAVVSLLDQ
jgi:hypothetical protein